MCVWDYLGTYAMLIIIQGNCFWIYNHLNGYERLDLQPLGIVGFFFLQKMSLPDLMFKMMAQANFTQI